MSKTNSLEKKLYFPSIQWITNTRVLCFLGMMGALGIVLGFVATIDFGPYVRIGFSGIPNQVVDYLFGPWIGALFGGVMDIIKVFAKGQTFFPGFTITAVCGGLIYGFFLYNKPIKVLNIFLSQLCVKVFCNLFLNTLWLCMFYGKSFLVIFPERLASNAVMLPVDTFIAYAMLKAVAKVIKPYFQENARRKSGGEDIDY